MGWKGGRGMKTVTKYWGTLAAIAGPLIIFLTPSLDAYAQTHPHQLVAALIGYGLTLFHSTAPGDK